MFKKLKHLVVVLLVVSLLVSFVGFNSLALDNVNPAFIQSITVTNGSVEIYFDSDVSGLSSSDLTLTATLDGTEIALANLLFNPDTNSYTFTPLTLSLTGNYLEIQVCAASADSTKIAGGVYAGIGIPAILQEVAIDNGIFHLVYTQASIKLTESDIILTAKLDNNVISLENLAFDTTTDTFTFTPIPQTTRDQYFEIALTSETSPGSISAGMTIPAYLNGKVEIPEASPPTGTAVNYGSPIILNDSTPDALIYYSISTDPNKLNYIYDNNNPPIITGDATLSVWAIKEGMYPSDTAQFSYTLNDKVNIPFATPRGGLIDAGGQVTLTCSTPDTQIYYTTDGTIPTSSSNLYSTPLTVNSAVTITAIGIKSGLIDSNIATYTYTIKQKVHSPAIWPASGVITYGTQIIITCQYEYEPRVIYTTDGSDPTLTHGASCMPWGAPAVIGIVKGNMTIKALASKSQMTNSNIVTVNYICKAAAPTTSLSTGPVLPGSSVILKSIVPDSSIYYTTNGSDPSDISNNTRKLYSTGLIINSPTTIKAVTIKDGILNSDIASFSYDIKKMNLNYYWDKKKLEGFTITNNYSLIPDVVEDYIDITQSKSPADSLNFGNLNVWYTTSCNNNNLVRKICIKTLKDNPSTILIDFKADKPSTKMSNTITIHIRDITGMTSSINYEVEKNGKLSPHDECR